MTSRDEVLFLYVCNTSVNKTITASLGKHFKSTKPIMDMEDHLKIFCKESIILSHSSHLSAVSVKLQKCSCLHTKSKESFQSISGLREDFFPQKWMFCNAQADSHTENHSNMSSSKWQSLQLWHHAILEPKSWDEWISNESTYNTANMTWDYS